MSASEDEQYCEHDRPAKRQKTFTFQRFAQRVQQVNVDVYRQLGEVRSEPLPGSSSFFQEQVSECRELNTTAEWLAVASAANPLAMSMPLLLHHQAQIVDILLGVVKLESAISLPPVLHILSCLARDLQQDFLSYLPRVLSKLCSLVESGADRHPELLSDVFSSLSNIFKHLIKHVAPELPSVLRNSAPLLYSPAAHVRQLAADALGYLFRHSSSSVMRAAVQTVLAQHASEPLPERCDGAGRLLAAAVKGVSNGLHSRAPALLLFLLQQDLPTSVAYKQHQAELLCADAAAVTCKTLEHLLHHLRRGKGQTLWKCLLDTAQARLALVNASGSDSVNALASLARVTAHIAQCTEFIRGSRVEDYRPLLELLAKIAKPALLSPPSTTTAETTAAAAAQARSAKKGEAAQQVADDQELDFSKEADMFMGVTLSEQALRLMTAIVAGHQQAVGASTGLTALTREVQAWSPLLSSSHIIQVLPAVQRLIRQPAGGPEVAQMLGPQLMAAVGRAVLSGDASLQQLGMPLLVELCNALSPSGSLAQPSGLPVILKAEKHGVQLAAHVNSLVSSWPQSATAADGSTAAASTLGSGKATVAAAWAAVLCLPQANSSLVQVKKLLQSLVKATSNVLQDISQPDSNSKSAGPATTRDSSSAEEVLFLHCYARGVLGAVLESHDPQELSQHLHDTLQLMSQHPLNFHVVQCAAEVASCAAKGGHKLPLQQLQEILPAVEPNLSHPSQAMRCATLRLLCCFDQPAMLSDKASKTGNSSQTSQILPMCLSIQSQSCTVDSGRQAAVTIGKLQTYLEYGQVPPEQKGALVRCLIGMLHIRFALLWPPCTEALATALDHSPEASWPLVFEQLTTAQGAFLSGMSSVATAGRSSGQPAKAQDSAEMPQLQAELAKAMSSGDSDRNGGCTDCTVRLGNVLKAMTKTPAGCLDAQSRDWVPLFITFSHARRSNAQADSHTDPDLRPHTTTNSGSDVDDSSDSESDSQTQQPKSHTTAAEGIAAAANVSHAGTQQKQVMHEVHVGAKAWRGQLKSWLGFMGAVRGARGGFRSEDLKQCVVQHIQDTDSGVQQAALKALQVFKISFVAPYAEQLQKLAADQSLRVAMTAFALGPGADPGIASQHRAGLIPLLVRLLYPKMRKRSGRLGGKGAPGSARAAILNYLAALEPSELAPLVHLFLQPVSAVFKHQDSANADMQGDSAIASKDRLFPTPWWADHLGQHDGSWCLHTIDPGVLHSMPSRQRMGILNAAHDLLKHLGHKLKPFLPEMCALVLTLLQGVSVNAIQGEEEAEGASGDSTGARSLRSSALRFWATVLERFPDSLDFNCFWGPFLQAVELQMPRMATEAASVRAPALLECVAAMAASPCLLPVLAGQSSIRPASTAPALAPSDPTSDGDKSNDAFPLGHKLMRSAIAVLAVPNCMDAARNASLNIVENLLDSEGELGNSIIMAHVDQLLESLKAIVVTAWAAPAGKASKAPAQKKPKGKGQQQQDRGPSKKVGARCLAILEQLAAATTDLRQGLLLADALMPLLQQAVSASCCRKGRGAAAGEATAARTLAVLTAVWRQLSAGATLNSPTDDSPVASSPSVVPQLQQYGQLLSPLLGALSSPEARQATAAAFVALSGLLPEMATVAHKLTGLNRRSDSMVGEMDYDSSLAAYAELQVGFWLGIRKIQGLPLMHQCFWDLRNPDDLALRHAAAQALSRCLTAAQQQQQQGGEEEGGVAALVQQSMFSLVKKGLTAVSLAVRQEHVSLLRELVTAFPADYVDLDLLLDKDTELDFFLNVAHLQLHRRQRALQRLTKMLGEQRGEQAMQLGLSTVLGVFAPLLQQFIFEGKAAEDSGHDIKQIDRDREANVTDAAVKALAALAGCLPWTQYHQLLNQWLNTMRKTPTKAVIRGVCAIIDAFSFSVPSPPGIAEQSDAPTASDGNVDQMTEEAAADGAAADQDAVEAAEQQLDIQSALTRRVLPSLRSQLIHNGEVVRAPVALAMVKLLKLLPEQAMSQQLPQALQGVAHLLRNRLQRIRDDARNVLVAMMAELGVSYLYFAIQVLQNACPAKGYTAHVLGYTLHAVLEAVSKEAPPGALDGYLDTVLPIMEADLFGDIADAKEADAFAAKYREAKKCKAHDMYQLLARLITFRDSIGKLLAPVRTHLADASQPKVYNKLTVLLQHASRGIQANQTANPKDLMTFIHGVLEGGLAQEEAAREAAEAEATAAVHVPGQQDATEDEATAQHDHMLVDFALGLLHAGLKKGSLGGQSPAALALLDPMLPLLVRAVKSRHANSVSLALKCLAVLTRLPLPGMAAESASAGRAVTSLLQRMARTGDPIAQDCFKLLATLLRESESYKPTTAQLRFLLTWAFGDMEEAAHRQAAFSLLKAVLQRKLVVPEVYDIMTKVQEMMVRSQAAPVRQLCATVLLQFLLDYPVGDRRLQQHLQFIITNLSYEHETGREAAIEMLKVIINKFPEQLVDEWCEVFFLPLAQRLSGDPSSKCRESVGACLRALMQRVSSGPLDKLVQYCVIWLGGNQRKLTRTAAQALGVLVQLESSKFGRRVPVLLPLLARALQQEAQVTGEGDLNEHRTHDGDSAETRLSDWQEAYACLLLLERLAIAVPSQVAWQRGSEVQGLWQSVVGLLAYPHAWLRKVAGRLLGLLLSNPKLGAGMMLSEGTKPGQLALAVYCQLEADIDDALAAQAVKCLVHLSKNMLAADKAAGLITTTLAADAEQISASHDQHRVQKHDSGQHQFQSQVNGNAQLASAGEQGSAEAADSEDEEEEVDERNEHQAGLAGAPSLTLQGLVRRMTKMAGDRTFHRQLHRTWALKFIAALTSRLGKDGIMPYLDMIMQPLYRIQESGSASNSDETKQLGQEILAHIRDVAGTDALVSSFAAAKKAVTAVRSERKRRAAVQVLVDPEAAARTKLHKQERRAAGRKRKMEEMQRRRGAGVAVKNKKKHRQAAA